MRREVILRPSALADLKEIHDYIEKFSPVAADRYIERIEAFCMRLADFSERGTRRDDWRVGMRTIGFQRRVTVAFVVLEKHVEIARILYGGRDVARALVEDNS